MPCYYPRAHLHSSWTSPCPPPLPRPGPPSWLPFHLSGFSFQRMTMSPVPLPYIWRTPQYLLPSPVPLLLPPRTRAWASNWPRSPPSWVWAGKAWGQRTDPHLPPSSPDFLPMKCLVLNYSHPTLIVIDWGSRGSGRMTDRLGSLWACPPRRGEGEENEEWGSVQDNSKSHSSTIYSHRLDCCWSD